LLEPGGVFANFEHVASPTRRLHLGFFEAINEPIENEDPSDRTLDVQTQLEWLQALDFQDVDCYWKWLEMALLVAIKPPVVGLKCAYANDQRENLHAFRPVSLARSHNPLARAD
jgi:hypothetical protein